MGKKKPRKKETTSEKKVDLSRFEALIVDIKEFFGILDKKDEETKVEDLDAKLIEKLENIGESKLAEEISELKDKEAKNSFKNFFSNPLWVNWAVGSFLVITVIATFLTYMTMTPTDTYQDKSFTELQKEQPIPQVTMKPEKVTNSGYIAEENTFVMKVDGALESDAKKYVKVSPDVEVRVEVKDNGSEVVVEPKEKLKKGQNYVITLQEGAKFTDGAELKKEISWVVKVEPDFAVIGTTPRDEVNKVPVDASIEIEFNHKNISEKDFKKAFSIEPSVKGKIEKHGLRFVFLPENPLNTNTIYKVNVDGDYANQEGEKLGEDYEFTFKTGEQDSTGKYVDGSNVSLYTENVITNFNTEIYASVNNYSRNSKSVANVELFSVPEKEALSQIKDSKGVISYVPEGSKLVESKKYKESGVYRYSPGSDSGFYILKITDQSGIYTDHKYFIHTNLGFVADTKDVAMGWVFDMNQEKPISKAQVTAYSDNEKVGSSKTDGKGFFKIEEIGNLLIAKHNGNYAVYHRNATFSNINYCGAGFSCRFDNIEYSRDEKPVTGYLTMDRPLYQPGDKVYFKAVLREIMGDTLEPVEKGDFKVIVGDYYYGDIGAGSYSVESQPLHEDVYTVNNEFGTISGSFNVPVTTERTYASINVVNDGRVIASKSFDISSYTKASEKYSVSLDKTRYKLGDTIKATVTGLDYSDQPLSGQKVRVKLIRGEVNSYELEDGEYNIYPYSGTNVIDEKVVTLDDNGRYHYSHKPKGVNNDSYVEKFTISVSDIDDEYEIVAEQSAAVAEVNYHIDADVNRYVHLIDEGETTDVKVEFASYRLWSGEKVGNKDFSINLERTWYEEVEVGTEYDEELKRVVPRYEDVKRVEDVELSKTEFTTDSKGDITASLQGLKEGDYALEVFVGVDKLRYNYLFSVNNLDGYSQGSLPIEISENKGGTKPGEEAEVEIRNQVDNLNGFYVISTSEVKKNEIISMDKGDTMSVKFKLTEDMYPTAHVCVYGITQDNQSGIKDKGWVADCSTVAIESDKGVIEVGLETDKKEYTPGEKVKATITTKDYKGNPIATEVALGVIDQSLLDLSYYTQSWQDSSQLIRDNFYNYERRFNFKTTNYNYRYIGGAGGGGGAGGDTRTIMPDTAYWNPVIRTNDKGKATVEFVIPDSLTTWNVKALAVSADHDYGVATGSLITQLDTFVQLDKPQFIRYGDKMSVDVQTANFSKPYNGSVRFECEGCKKESAKKTLDIGKNERKNFEFEVQPKSNTEELKLTVTLKKEGETVDKVEYTVPVYINGLVESRVLSEIIETDSDSEELKFELDENLRKDVTKVDLYISKAFALEQFEATVDPTVRSTSELASAINHNAFMYKHYNELDPDVSREDIKQRIDYYIELMLANQSSDGGFSWFDYDAVSLDSSVLATEALKNASEVGVEVPSVVTDRAIGYFINVIDEMETEKQKYSVHHKVEAFYGLSQLDTDTALIYKQLVEEQFDNSEEASEDPLTIAYLMLSYENIGSTGDSSSVSVYLRDIAIEGDRSMYWEGSESDNKVTQSSEYVTAMVYQALAPLERWEMKYKVRNWLLDRDLANYSSNDEYMRIIYALAQVDQENVFTYDSVNELKVEVNGEEIDEFELGTENSAKTFLTIDSEYLKSGENKVKLTRDSGEGDLYLTASVEEQVKESQYPDKGFKNLTRKFYDLNSSKEIKNRKFSENQLIKVSVAVEADGDYDNVLFRDYIPSGFEPVRFNLKGVSEETRRKFWTYGNYDENLNRGGIAANDFVTFNTREMKKGKKYRYEYLLMAKDSGELSGGGTHVFVDLFPDIGIYTRSEEISVN